MDTTALQTVVLVAEHGSFAATARLLDVDPSSVSRMVAAVEADIGLRLFQRSTRRLALTDGGARYLERVAPLLEQLEQARESALDDRSHPRGRVRLSTSVAFGTMCLVPRLAAFRAAWPDIEMELVLTDRNLDLVADRIDLALRLAPAPAGDLVSTRLMTTRYRVCVAPGWLEGRRRPDCPQDLASIDCLRQALPDYRSRWLFRPGGETRDPTSDSAELMPVPVSGSLTVSNPMALREAARESLGPALLADWLIARDLADGSLLDLFPDHEVTATTFDTGVWALYPSRAWLPASVRVTIDFLRRCWSA